MGFLKTIKLSNGLSVGDAYHRIHAVSGTKDEITLLLTAYKSQEDFLEDTDLSPLAIEPHAFNPDVADDAENFFKQGYEYLKKIDKYTSVVDVLEKGQVAE